jgi:chromosomal replication initiation ATPase DnaA
MTYLAYKSATRPVAPSAPVIKRKILTLPQKPSRQTFPISKILNAVSEAAWFELGDIIGPSREHHLVKARMAAYYLCRTHSKASFPRIGQFVGGRDHSTVIYGYQQVKSNPEKFADLIHAAEAILFGGQT